MGKHDWADLMAETNHIVDNAINTLQDIQLCIREEEAIKPASLHNLYDMVEDAAESSRIRLAEDSFAWRQNTHKDSL